MAFCSNCGASIENGAAFCPNCGAAVNQANNQANNQQQTGFADKFNEINNTPDTTAYFDPADIEKNKLMAVLSYIGWLVLVPIIAAKQSPFARFHANQGLVLAIAVTIVNIVLRALAKIPAIGVVFSIASTVISIALIALEIIGIVNAAKGRAKELPIIGKFRILK